jgi:hypothetical protein
VRLLFFVLNKTQIPLLIDFIFSVIRRLMTLLVTISTLAATSEANMRQAQSASRVAEELMNNQAQEGDGEKNKELAEAIEKKNSELKEAREGEFGACHYFHRFLFLSISCCRIDQGCQGC